MPDQLLIHRDTPTSDALHRAYTAVRETTLRLAQPLTPEDCVVQSMPDVSPIRWHLAHTTWFFETFVLARAVDGHRPFHPEFGRLFNSYYRTLEEPFPRARRGLVSRPGMDEIRGYRAHVDGQMDRLLASADDEEVLRIVQLGLHHEQQHQELILTDIKHVLSCNPLRPAYRERPAPADGDAPRLRWTPHEGGLGWFGHTGEGFGFDNEFPRHRAFLEPFELASRPVTNREFEGFVEDGGYRQPALWLDDGWATVRSEGWEAPLYWERRDGAWWEFTLDGLRRLSPAEPVCHVSYFEADAFARWAGARLPTEREWEAAAAGVPVGGNFADSGDLHPRPAPDGRAPAQLFGDVWEWTSSAYDAYPGFRPVESALGEYNGKFMCNQFVLRGGSCATPRGHVRATYRNFFQPSARWQMTGLRLAR